MATRIQGSVGVVGSEGALADVTVTYMDDTTPVTSVTSSGGLYDLTGLTDAVSFDLTFEKFGYVTDFEVIRPVTFGATTIRFKKSLMPVSKNNFDHQLEFDVTSDDTVGTTILVLLKPLPIPVPHAIMSFDIVTGILSFLSPYPDVLAGCGIDQDALFTYMIGLMGDMPAPVRGEG